MTEADISSLAVIVKDVLEQAGVDYWLGRGVLRHIKTTGDIGDAQSDLDIHIWYKDKERVKVLLGSRLPNFYINDASRTPKDEAYKLAFSNDNSAIIEFMYLFTDNDDQSVYHMRGDGKHKTVPSKCFSGQDIIKIGSLDFPAPKYPELYLEGVYTKDWLDETKK